MSGLADPRSTPTATNKRSWRTDPTRAGASACLADIGVHAHSLALFVTGLELDAVSAELDLVPGRRLDDNAHVRFGFGRARGVLAASKSRSVISTI
jgi:predicted dehydrogenase